MALFMTSDPLVEIYPKYMEEVEGMGSPTR
jgi:hypothetical protein